MVIAGTRPVHRRARSAGATRPAARDTARKLKQESVAAPTCLVCRKNSRQVKFVITDPANRSNMCERCADECVRVFVCTCVC